MLGFRRLLRQGCFDYGPKFVGYEWFRHGRRILDHKVSLGTLSRTSDLFNYEQEPGGLQPLSF